MIVAGKQRKLDWRPSTKPHRRPPMLATAFHALRDAGEDPLPRRIVITRDRLPPVNDQGNEGSCVANAYCELLDFLMMRAGVPFRGSRQFAYAIGRMLEQTPLGEDAGMEIPDMFAAATATGVCSEATWPYSKPWNEKPSEAAFHEALEHQAELYFGLPDLFSIRASLHQGFPVACGMVLTAAFDSAEVALTGVVPYPAPGEKFTGGHAFEIIGVDLDEPVGRDGPGMLLCRNSWGELWGLAGDFKLSIRFAQPHPTFGVMIQDACTLRRAEVA